MKSTIVKTDNSIEYRLIDSSGMLVCEVNVPHSQEIFDRAMETGEDIQDTIEWYSEALVFSFKDLFIHCRVSHKDIYSTSDLNKIKELADEIAEKYALAYVSNKE